MKYVTNVFSEYHLIGINDAFRFGEWVDLCWFLDARWYWWNKEDFAKFKGLKVSGNRAPEILGSVLEEPDIKVVRRNGKGGICSKQNVIATSGNSGASAVNLAYHLGAKRIILVGFDMRMINGKKNWFKHPGPKHGGSAQKMSFHRFIRSFAYIAKDAKKLGLKIYNATPDSALTMFPKTDFEVVYECFK